MTADSAVRDALGKLVIACHKHATGQYGECLFCDHLISDDRPYRGHNRDCILLLADAALQRRADENWE